MKLRDFVDLDRQLLRDSRAEEAPERMERDRRIGQTQEAADPASPDGDERLLLAWKDEVAPAGEGRSLGRLVEATVRWTAVLLVLTGFLAGASAAAALLRYDGTQPINVLFFLAAIVGVQLLLLPLLVFTFVFRRRFRSGWQLARDLLGGLMGRVFAMFARFGAPGRAESLRADLDALRAESSLYARVQPMLALSLLQVFGVAFNVAVAATLLFLVVFSDLTFAWSTTMQIEPDRTHGVVEVLSFPWAEWIPEASPSLELVEATRFGRMEGAFITGGPDAASRAGGWWPFLFVATIAYGLLPRLLALVTSSWLLRREMRTALDNHAQVRYLKERLRTPLVRVDADPAGERVPRFEGAPAPFGSQAPQGGLSLGVVFWAYDEIPDDAVISDLLRNRLGATGLGRFQAGRLDASDRAVLGELARAKEEGRIDGAAVFFEPFEPPKSDVFRFLEKLRDTLGPSAPIVAFLAEFDGATVVAVESNDRDVWERAIGSIGDPHLLMGTGEVPS